MKTKGDCYEANARFILGYKIDDDEKIKKEGYKLIHGVTMNTTDGKAMGHCWVEKDDMVYDYSNDKEVKMPKFLYYELGHIPFDGHKLYKYDWDEVGKMMIKHKSWGPWESKPPR